jgi:metal-responsive CopG/Arc/MetJ family transcriptional regulator
MRYKSTKSINITIPIELLTQLDQVSLREYTTRSDIIRQAVLDYIRNLPPVPRLMTEVEEEMIFNRVRNRRLKNYLDHLDLDYNE